MFENQLRRVALPSLALFLSAQRVIAQQTPAIESTPNGSPSPTPPVFSPQTLSDPKAVEYVAAELKTLGCEVQLEKVLVPHWVRGEEPAALVQFPGQAPNTTQKIVLCALGGSVATPKDGIETEVLVVKNFNELKSMPR